MDNFLYKHLDDTKKHPYICVSKGNKADALKRNKMKAIINYTDIKGVNTSIEFDNLEDVYSFSFFNGNDAEKIISVEVIGEGVYTNEEFQTAYSNDEF